MKKTIIFLFMLWSIFTNAQTVRCVSDQVLSDLINSDYDAKLKVDALNDYLTGHILMKQDNTPSITIPVEINILHNNQALGVGANISDSQVLDQLAALNSYYNSYGISFCLATKAGGSPIPNNGGVQNTPGIIHYNTTLTTHTANSAGQQAIVGLLGASVTRSKYLRIWVVSSINGASSGILGYSMFPNVSPIFDGIVMRYDVFGNGNPNLLTNYNLGKTLVHEVGHYLGLYHTFEGGCAGMTGSNCITAGDRVCDTPPVAAPNFSCTAGTNSCIEPSGDQPDAINNYMDYGDNNCSTSFTLGQKWRMYDTVNFARNELISDENLIYTGVTCINPNTITAKFTANSYYSCLTGNSITFTPYLNSSSLTYSWNFGDPSSGTNNISSSIIPSHTFSAASNTPYNVTLNVSDGTLTATYSVKIFIRSCSAITGPESTWYFSASNALSFSSGVPTVVAKTFPQSYTFSESCAQQNSSTGSVLFYTNGYSVWKDNSSTQINSTGLMGSYSSKNGVLILPNPANVNQYYVFTIDAFYGTTSPAQGLNGLRYSIVTVTSGVPSMTTTNTPVTIPTGFLTGNNGAVLGGEGLTAMERCGGGYWIFTTLKSSTGNYIVVYSLSTTGALSVVNSSFQIPASVRPDLDWASSIKLSPNGNKLLYISYYQKSYLCDFNKYTGVTSNAIELSKCYGASFSPDSSLLYTDSAFTNSGELPDTFYVYQYNVNSNNIVNSKKIIGSSYGVPQDMQIGPDNKIYQALRSVNRLGTIHNPNTIASQNSTNECNYTTDGVVTNGVVTNSLPNFINAKTVTAFPTTASISSYPTSCLVYKFVPNACGTSYSWTFGDSASGANNTSTLTVPTHTFSGNGTYTVTLKNSSNVVIATTTVTIGIAAPTIVGSTSICPSGHGGSRSTNNSVTLAAGQSVVWTTSATGTIVGANNQASVDVNWTAPGTLTATITSASGCTASSTKNIVEDSVTAAISADYTCFSTSDYSTTHTTTIPPGYTALWTFENGIEGTFNTPDNQATVGVNWQPGSTFGYLGLMLTNPAGCTFYGSKSVYDQCVCNCFSTRTYSYTKSNLTITISASNSDPACLSAPGGGTRYNYGDGTSGYSAIHTYAAAGTYTVTITGIIKGAFEDTLCVGPPITLSVTVNCKGCLKGQNSSADLTVYPNPASSLLNIDVSFNSATPLEVVLKSIDGKELLRKKWNMRKGKNDLQLELPSNISDGMIFVELISDEISETRTILIKK